MADASDTSNYSAPMGSNTDYSIHEESSAVNRAGKGKQYPSPKSQDRYGDNIKEGGDNEWGYRKSTWSDK